MKSIWSRRRGLRCIYVFLFSVTLRHAAKNWKSLNYKISYEKKKISFTKYQWEKKLDPRNSCEISFWTHEISTRKKFGPTKYLRKKILDPRITYKNRFWTHKVPTKARWHDSTRRVRPTTAHSTRNLAPLFKLQSQVLWIGKHIGQREITRANT